MPEEEMTGLTAGQNAWQELRTKAVEDAGRAFEGGSMYALVVNMEAANLAQARAYELYEILK